MSEFLRGVSEGLQQGVEAGRIEKTHLIVNRVLQNEASLRGEEWIDMGTDYYYPFFHGYAPTEAALVALHEHRESSLHYPSSYGLLSLRKSFSVFMEKQFGVGLDIHREIMINTGASQAFDAFSRSFAGTYVALPKLSLPTVATISTGNGAKMLRLPSSEEIGFIDLDKAGSVLQALPDNSIRFLYLNSPSNPTGDIASYDYLEQLVAFARQYNLRILHDMDSWYTTHEGDMRPHNILEIPGAKDNSVTVLSISKEFGLPGLRVGFLAGNEEIIDVIREHNSTFGVMIPEPCQYAAQAAFDAYDPERDKREINRRVTEILDLSIEGWSSLGWPRDSIKRPQGGFKYLVPVPANIPERIGQFSGVELLDFFIARRCAVKLSSSRSFNPEENRYIRIVLMQDEAKVVQALERLRALGISYNMDLPSGITYEYSDFLRKNVKSDF